MAYVLSAVPLTALAPTLCAVSLPNLTIPATDDVAALYVGMLTFQLPNNELLLTVLIFVPDTRVSCLAFKAVAKFVLSVGCPLIVAKVVVILWFNCNSQEAPSYTYVSHTAKASVSTVVDAVQV